MKKINPYWFYVPLLNTWWRQPLTYSDSPPPVGCGRAVRSDQWPPCSPHLGRKTSTAEGAVCNSFLRKSSLNFLQNDLQQLFYLLGQQYQPASWLARCTARRRASQTCCTAWWRLQCPARALWCPCEAVGRAGYLSPCPQRFSYPAAAGGEDTGEKLHHPVTTLTENVFKKGTMKGPRLTWRSSLSAKDIIPSKMITLAPYRFFCKSITQGSQKKKATSLVRKWGKFPMKMTILIKAH